MPDSLRSYRNPILPGFFPDPSCCRVGEDFYLVTSTFQWFPGVPVFHSRDLVNWRCLGYCLNRPSQLPLQNTRPSEGIYAPVIRHHAGRYYMITTNITQGGNFIVSADNPAGPWSEPLWIRDLPGIDPSLFFDDDGQVYVQSTGEGRGIVQAKIDLATGRLRTPPLLIWHGTGGRYPEGPHLFKHLGNYYLLIAEGGTEYGHMVTIARSDNPWGIFTPCPANPILTHRDTNDHPIQGTGHSDLFQDAQGNWWLVFLAYRPISGRYYHLGRETFLAPVSWNAEGWPVINSTRLIEFDMQGPLPPVSPVPPQAQRDDFDLPELSWVWNTLRGPGSFWSLTERPGWLRLQGTAMSFAAFDTPAFIAQRLRHLQAKITTQLDFLPSAHQEQAGLCLFMDERNHVRLIKTLSDSRPVIQLWARLGEHDFLLKQLPAPTGGVCFRVEAQREKFVFSAGADDQHLSVLDSLEAKYLSTEVAGGFTGLYLGLLATGQGQPCINPADFDWFEYSPGQE